VIKLVERAPALSASKGCLAYRVVYIADQDHPDHGGKGKIVLTSRNYNCGESVKEYLMAVAEAHALGKSRNEKRKTGSRAGGNPTKDLFLEFIYNSPKGSYPTPGERELIETMLVAEFRNCAIRCAWHLNPATGTHDFHFLVAARDRFGNATMNRFGDGKPTFVTVRNKLDQEICDILNSSREIAFEPANVVHRRNLGELLGTELTELWEMIAHSTREIITRENLADVIKALGHEVTNAATLFYEKSVFVIFKDRQETKHFRIPKLLLQIAEGQLDRPEGLEGEEGGAGGESGGGSGGLAAPKKKTKEVAPTPASPKPTPIGRPSPAKKAAKKAAKKKPQPPLEI